MIVVSGTKRSGTSMWMQVLRAAGFQPLGRAFPGDWGQTIADANPDGFYESRFRSGIFHATNPLPETGAYIHPDASRNAVVKIFPFGVRKTHRAFLDRLADDPRESATLVQPHRWNPEQVLYIDSPACDARGDSHALLERPQGDGFVMTWKPEEFGHLVRWILNGEDASVAAFALPSTCEPAGFDRQGKR